MKPVGSERFRKIQDLGPVDNLLMPLPLPRCWA